MNTPETYNITIGGRPDHPLEAWGEQVLDAVQDLAGHCLIDVRVGPDMPVFLIKPEGIREVARALRAPAEGISFAFLLDVTAVDYSLHHEPRPARFAVIWHFLDLARGRRVRVKAYVAEGQSVPTLTGEYAAADWAEREIWDMMGIPFAGHPNMIRILMPDDYEGHPQRKDFPICGPDRAKRITGEMQGNKPLVSWKELHEL
jgi:NADH:ubiquinone oxidoreductase subunit C